MRHMYVDVEALNFRSTPLVSHDNLIGKLYLAQRIEVLKKEEGDWIKCRARINGAVETGYASGKYLRQPFTETREALIASAHREYMRFDRGLGKEYVQPYAGYVGEMWKAIGIKNIDGTDRDQWWSAAAISFMVRKSGTSYAKFRFAAAHSKFVHHAIKARENNDRSVPFWGYRLHEVRPFPGDIVARDNPTKEPKVDYDLASLSDSYNSHTDIIVRVDSKAQRLLAIGGNVGDSVGIASYSLAPGDYLSDANHTFAILKNITDLPQEYLVA